ncbi:MAG: hypothetical protein R3223_08505 [Longimicrobiales bacterium]|nr:hypothetical protein [Longimicrobiales bacterium]
MNGFLGRYEYQMDGKGRVSLPAAFRRVSDDDRFVLLQWEKPYLSLFPESEWIRFRDKLIEYRKSGPGAAFHVRDIMSKAVEVTPDGQGRILIPAWLQEAAGLDGSVLLNGNIDRVEIWDPEAYEEAVESRDEEEFGRFARQIFG